MNPPAPAPGFTLIELLVVIAILGLLAGLLLPSLARAKAKAGGIKCLANNRQLLVAWQMYTGDNRDRLLYATEGADPRTREATWVTGVTDFNPANRSNWDIDFDIKKSPLWSYAPAPEIWRCPADTSGVRVRGQFRPRVRSMSMNVWVGGFAGEVPEVVGTGFRVFLNLNDFVDPGPSQTWLLVDQREDSINWGNFFTAMHGWPDRPTDYRFIEDIPASYHHRAGGVSFVDGHAEIRRWVDPRTMPPLLKGSSAYANRGTVPSPNNRDIRWLQERATRKR